ncbi:hypothetical protein EC991_007235 [Linnemannia zychae]|nr:hypothetical protein EC991_007235 [Linnemannia zychae]
MSGRTKEQNAVQTRMTRSRAKAVIRGETQPARVVTPRKNGVSVEEKEELVEEEESVTLEEAKGTLEPGLPLPSPTRSRLLVSIPMTDTKRKLNNTSDQPHSSPQKHRRLSQGRNQQTSSPSSPLHPNEQQPTDQDESPQLQDDDSEGNKADTVPSQSQPDQEEQSQTTHEEAQSVTTSPQLEINDNALSKESTAPQTPALVDDAAEDPTLDVAEGTQHGAEVAQHGAEGTQHGAESRTKLSGPDENTNTEETPATQHRRKRARTSEKAEGDGIQDDDDDSDPEEDEENQVVPEYVLREMQAFEQGFNGLQGKFKLLDKIGAGTFSSVYKAIDLEHDKYDNAAWDYEMEKIPGADGGNGTLPATTKLSDSEGGKVVALKRIYVTSSPDRIENEIAILHDLSGHKNVVPLITAFRFMDQVIVVLPYFEHRDFREYYKTLSMDGIRCYFRALLKALLHVHNQNIIHRDIKPSNFLYDVERKTGMLVDFGLAQRQESSRKTYRESYPRSSSSKAATAERPSASTSRHVASERASTPASSAPAMSRPMSASTIATRTRTSAAAPTTTPSTVPAATAQAFLMQRSGAARHDKENNAPMSARSMLESRVTSRTAHTTAANVTPMHPAAASYVSRSTVPNPAHNPSHSTRHQTTTRDFAATLQNPFQRQRPGVHIGNASTNAVSSSPSLPQPSQGRQKHNSFVPHSENLQLPLVGPTPKPTRALGFNKRDTRPVIRVNRAGTRGFRAPEILFRHVEQTVALDIWSVGVILLCFLSGRFPFFHSDDDLEALLEIAVVFGQREMAAVAATFNRTFVTNIPAIKDYGVSRARICRLLNPTRFGKPDHRSSRSSRSSQVTEHAQSSSARDSQRNGSATPLAALEGNNVDKQPTLAEAVSRSRAHNDLLTRGQDSKKEPLSTVSPAPFGKHSESETKTTHSDTKSQSTSKSKDTEKINFLEIEDTYKSHNDTVGTENEEDFLDAISLLEKLMTLDPTKRITAKQALKHRFLAEDKP